MPGDSTKVVLKFYLLFKVASTSFLARGTGLTIVRHARKTREKEKPKIETNMAARGFFPARLLCPVLNEFRVYPRLYLLVRPMLIPYVQDKLFLEFNVKFNLFNRQNCDRS